MELMRRLYDHIDLRVRSLKEARAFYEAVLPALGVTEAREHTANECRIAFWAQSTAEVDRLAHIVAEKGGRQIEGPGYLEGAGYYAVFFEDPSGNRLEICHRVAGAI
jgi:catechol 2,3-dioxygenase-like lactoylglutathione lyase family enzyme